MRKGRSHLFFWQDFVKNLVTDGLGVELNNKVNEMNLILANHISDKVIDDVIDNLSRWATRKGNQLLSFDIFLSSQKLQRNGWRSWVIAKETLKNSGRSQGDQLIHVV